MRLGIEVGQGHFLGRPNAQIRDWLRVLEVPVADLCHTVTASLVLRVATRVVVANLEGRLNTAPFPEGDR